MILFENLYEIRNGKVYWNGNVIPGADPRTFEWLGDNWARDANSIYVHDSRRRGIDASTFIYLNPVFVKDANGVYDWAGIIKGADPNTFSVLDPGVYVEEGLVTRVWARGYGRDCSSVYYHDQMIGRATVVRGADPGSFVSLRNDYGYDKSSVWFQKFRLKRADPNTWIYLGRAWSMDRDRVFYFEREVKGVDRSRFTVVGAPTIGNYATDCAKYFNADREMSGDDFWANVEGHIASFPTWLRVSYGKLKGGGCRE